MKKKVLALLLYFGIVLMASACKKTETQPMQVIEIVPVDENVKEKLTFLDEKIISQMLQEKIKEIKKEIEEANISITISAVGDCTLGRDDKFSYQDSLPYVLEQQNNDYSYFFRGVYDILSNDDLTIANLESPLTDSETKASKQFAFKGPADYTNILTTGSVEAVNLANNHTMDYLEKGYNDTIETLEQTPIHYFGNGIYSIAEIKGKKIGMCGIKGWDVDVAMKEIDKAMVYFESMETDLEIFSFHWGEESVYKQNSSQEKIARYAIDCGADLILGHHPHVPQGIEYYNDRYIAYSLGNFVFGGNKNPSDKDTMIFQITFNYEGNELVGTDVKIIPASVSSTNEYNDYQPTIAEGAEKERILEKILKSSTNFDYEE